MCGIAGIVTHDGRPPEEALLRQMAGALAHRGPDGEGIWNAPGIGLTHRRLSIIDLSARASQPMRDREGKFTIVFNGEIYNYRELRMELGEDLGWQSDSDTEVIMEGYRRWGDDVVLHLRGMFAFALWDNAARRLLVARDRIGKKPLFYTKNKNGDLLFASEIKAFRGLVDLAPDPQAIRLFLGLQYVPAPRTGFAGVFQLEPGMSGVWEQGEWKVKRYHAWDGGCASAEADDKGKEKKLLERLEEAVKIRLLTSDVPVGAFLSGGIDSAAVVALASRHTSRPLHTFTLGFSNPAWDERESARTISRHFKTRHADFEAKPEDLIRVVDALVDHYDAPYADSSALPVWLLAQETAKHIKVVLTGDGGDEVFGGYRRYAAYDRALRLSRFHLPSSIFHFFSSLLRDPRFMRMGDVVETCRHDPALGYGEMFCGSYFSSRAIRELCLPEFLEESNTADAVAFVADIVRRGAVSAPGSQPGAQGEAQGEETSPLRRAMRFDLTSYLPDDLNVKMDRATMRFGLEARAPFLDQELVAWALTLPIKDKVAHGKTKILLRRALKDVLPEKILRLPKKGFQVPLADWFRGPLKNLLQERCTSVTSPLRAFMNIQIIERLIDENDRGYDHGNRLWMLLSLATWLQKNTSTNESWLNC